MVITSKNIKQEVDWVPTVEEKEPAGVAKTTTDVKDVTFTSSVSEQNQRRQATTKVHKLFIFFVYSISLLYFVPSTLRIQKVV